MKTHKVLTLSFLLIYSIAYCSGQDSIKNYKESNELKNTIENLNKEILDIKSIFKEEERKFNVRESEIKYYVQEKYMNWWVSSFPIIMLAIAVFGLFGTAVWWKTRAQIIIDTKVQNSITKYIESSEYRLALEKKIKNQIAENRFKQLMKIHVISGDPASENTIRNYFQENEFPLKNISYSIGTERSLIPEHVDVLFINNRSNEFEQMPDNSPFKSLIQDVKKMSSNIAIIYFNNGRIHLPNDLALQVDGYASSFAAIYHNLIDVMRYKFFVIDKKDLDL